MLDGKALGQLFSWLRPNDLVWNYWVNNNLIGQDPPAFDVLAWNADSTDLPAGLHADFLDLFLHNCSPAGRDQGARHAGRPGDDHVRLLRRSAARPTT